jgi:CNT family concentrative nucleoside transporter
VRFCQFRQRRNSDRGYECDDPERRDEVVALAPRALLAGTMASALSGAMIGLLPL